MENNNYDVYGNLINSNDNQTGLYQSGFQPTGGAPNYQENSHVKFAYFELTIIAIILTVLVPLCIGTYQFLMLSSENRTGMVWSVIAMLLSIPLYLYYIYIGFFQNNNRFARGVIIIIGVVLFYLMNYVAPRVFYSNAQALTMDKVYVFTTITNVISVIISFLIFIPLGLLVMPYSTGAAVLLYLRAAIGPVLLIGSRLNAYSRLIDTNTTAYYMLNWGIVTLLPALLCMLAWILLAARLKKLKAVKTAGTF
ncbi:MAG: hypothetical protein LBQ95_02145 [Lachnospiraceae bacterium]|jgi:hypothetical protein|nr:hypothetical protein [Lachnospiraceae bacterium]